MKTHTFESHRDKYENVRMKREDGVLEVALHTRGGPLEFNGYVHEALVTRSAISATIGITTSRS